jgi:hypothetical protein
MKTLLMLTAALSLSLVPSPASAQAGDQDYIIIGGSEDPDTIRWIYTWWDERGVFHGVDSLDLVPTVFRDRAERTKAVDAIQLGVRLDPRQRVKNAPKRQRLRPSLPTAQTPEDREDRRRKTRSELEREQVERLTLLQTQLASVEEQLAAFEEGTIPTASSEDLELSDSQLDARLTHLETRYDYLTSEIGALNQGS